MVENFLYLILFKYYLELNIYIMNDQDSEFEIIATHAIWIGRVSEDEPKTTDKPKKNDKISKPQRKNKVK